MRGKGGSCGFSANEYNCAHHVTWSPNKLSTSIFNLWKHRIKVIEKLDDFTSVAVQHSLLERGGGRRVMFQYEKIRRVDIRDLRKK
jgi:hypothetical protein